MNSFSSEQPLLSFQQASEALLSDTPLLVETETLPLSAAHRRILAMPIIADINVPNADNSGMDGFAFRFSDLNEHTHLNIIGTAYAGHPFKGEWQPGGCIRIMTGAHIPQGFDTVIMQEQVTVSAKQTITLNTTPTFAQNVRKQGEDISIGSQLFASGQRLTATDIGMLASLGIASVSVYKPLKVGVISTGDELFEPGTPLSQGGIYDTNRFAIQAILNNLGFSVQDFGIIADEPHALKSAFEEALSSTDVIITSGGVSVGDADHTKTVLTELGQMQFWKVAIKPGKPFAYGHFKHLTQDGHNKRFMGLPGNLVSSVVTLHQLAIPALRKMAGETVYTQPPLKLPLATSISKKQGRDEFIRASLIVDSNGTHIVPLKGQGSGMLSTFAKSQGYLLLHAEKTQWQSGDLVPFIPFDCALN
ncbi:gephyrin-like molybdotransferase Glp [Pseudoalteromonas sp.]|uniref:molybdopterin molybdotransferase MoeA n=1 Tax=Pseudoalteromonas sp. TaxID=53249 RepID=UPI002610CAA9|nr:gephyrin-like molybdotransferase Glp [Pseudoalteromonas sp.]MCP4586420.1 molybdopterin molybdotransferase MoeA [Pseudoalteromonas sp.]